MAERTPDEWRYLLQMRTTRLVALIRVGAPKPVIDNELDLIQEAAAALGFSAAESEFAIQRKRNSN